MKEHAVVDIRATGVTPEAVRQGLEEVLNERSTDRWALDNIQPVIYNSSTTGYFLLFFSREVDK